VTKRHVFRGKRAIALAAGLTVAAASTAAASAPPAASISSTATSSPAASSPATTGSLAAAEVALPDGITERIGGRDRYEVAARIAAEYEGEANVVYIASGEVFADALMARGNDEGTPSQKGGTARIDATGSSAPILLTRSDRLPQATIDALTSIKPTEIRIIGGETRIKPTIETQLKAYGQVSRIGGADRYETSALVATGFDSDAPVVFVATGEKFPDALVGGALAGREGAPILLTKGDELRDVTADALTTLAPQTVVILGGPESVTETVMEDITALVPATTRVFGPDRYTTAAAISELYEQDLDRAYVATGRTYPDALTGSALAAYEGVPLLLTKDTTPDSTIRALDRLSPQGVTLLGGEVATPPANAVTLDALLPAWIDQFHLQLLSFNDYHGHLDVASEATLTPEQDPNQTPVGGAKHLSATLTALRETSLPEQSMTVAAGDLIGGSPFLSGIFHDEPSVESLNLMGLDVSSVGNHEFDEGTDELMRMQNGGCRDDDGCYFPNEPYPGADFPWLAANVTKKDGGGTLLPGTFVKNIAGIKVGFIGMTLQETPTLVSPGGVDSVEFQDEVETANASAEELRADGVEAIVVLIHEGGMQTGEYSQCEGISGPIVDIVNGFEPSIDMVVTGHTHQPYVCDIPDIEGDSRLVTSANQYGRVVTNSDVVLSQSDGDVVRDVTTSNNVLVTQDLADLQMEALVAKWKNLGDVVGAEVVGTLAEDISGSAGGNRGIETPLADLIADSILFGTEGPEGGNAQIAFTNVGGIRADLLRSNIDSGEEVGEITYAEAFSVLPFGNLLVSIDMTGADIKAVLEQQFIEDRGRQQLALGVSEGFTYTWDETADVGSRVSEMQLDGIDLDPDATYRVATLNFLAEGGDSFTAFTDGTNLLGGPGDFENLVDFFDANPGLTAPADRVAGL